MKGQLLWVNLALLLVLGYGAWALVDGYQAANERYAILGRASGSAEVPEPAAAPLAARLSPADYLATVVNRMLFSPDRNPVVEIVEGPAEPPPEARPPFPYLAGLMDLGKGPVAWMSPEREGEPHPVRPGDKVGPFEFVGATEKEIQLTWKEETFDVPFDEMRGSDAKPSRADRRPTRGSASNSAAQAAAQAKAAPNPNEPKRLGGQYNIGKEVTPGVFAGDPKDDSPDGTEYQGYVKRVQQTPFGKRQFWVKKP